MGVHMGVHVGVVMYKQVGISTRLTVHYIALSSSVHDSVRIWYACVTTKIYNMYVESSNTCSGHLQSEYS